MLFVFRNTPGTFQGPLEVILSSVIWQFALDDLDKTVIYIKAPEQHAIPFSKSFRSCTIPGPRLSSRKLAFSPIKSIYYATLFVLEDLSLHHTQPMLSADLSPQPVSAH